MSHWSGRIAARPQRPEGAPDPADPPPPPTQALYLNLLTLEEPDPELYSLYNSKRAFEDVVRTTPRGLYMRFSQHRPGVRCGCAPSVTASDPLTMCRQLKQPHLIRRNCIIADSVRSAAARACSWASPLLDVAPPVS